MDPVTGAQAINFTAFPQVPGVLEPVISGLQNVIALTQWLVGGLFGLYLIFLIMSWWQGRVKLTLLRDIREDLDLLNMHFKVKDFKKHRTAIPKKRWQKVMVKLFEEQEKNKKTSKKHGRRRRK